MYGQYRNSGIRRLADYAQALDRFNTTKPIRGRTDPSKPQVPLGHRNKINSYSIRKCQFTQDIECVLYQTPVVTFKANGEIAIKCDGWSSVSTASFIEEALGMPAYIYDHNLCVGTYTADGMQHYRVPAKGDIVFKRNEAGRLEYLRGAPETYTHKVNRKAINALRKKYADFKKYAIAMIKLKNGEFTRDEYALAFNDEYPALINNHTWRYDDMAKMCRSVLADMTNDTDDKFQHYYRALLIFARSYTTGIYSQTSVKAFEYGFNQFTLGVHRDEAFESEPVPLGKVKKDNYGKYWGKAWGAYHKTKPEGFELGSN